MVLESFKMRYEEESEIIFPYDGSTQTHSTKDEIYYNSLAQTKSILNA